MFAFRFALKNVLSRKSSLVIILFIAFSISLLVVSNAIFDGTDNGMEKTFVNSFTGNIVIRPKSDVPMSLFGDETPLTGKLTAIPELIPYQDVYDCVAAVDGIEVLLPQITGYSSVQFRTIDGGLVHDEFYFFGVEAEEYINNMTGIHIIEGRSFSKGEKGLMLSTAALKAMEDESERPNDVKVGENLTVYFTDGVSMTIRSVPLVGIYEYEVENPTLDQIVIIDPATLRAIHEIQDVVPEEDINPEDMSLIGSEIDDFDSLFADASDSVGTESLEQDFGTAEEKTVSESDAESTVWTFIICKTAENANVNAIIRSLNAEFKKNDWPVQAVKWRSAAGGSVAMVFYLRVILNIGILLILLTGFIVIANTLIISALSRVCETGTLRAIGAKSHFIALQFLFETLILTVTAGIAGCAIGVMLNSIIQAMNIHISNTLLIQLFGGTSISPVLTSSNLLGCMVLSALLAVVGWIYPLRIALAANPVVAMRGQA
ncbi:MAG: FtsX-like permease family protein [Treponema sp.]|nr:FtsX-like permease family protein [Treponema sp.]